MEPQSAQATMPMHVALDDASYERLNCCINRSLGLSFPPQRRSVLENRLQGRLRQLGFTRFADYCDRLDNEAPEEVAFLAEAVTNNETYFLRERDQFDALFAPSRLAALLECANGPVRFLSAGCSSGEEAYTLAFYAASRLAPGAFAIDGFDVDAVRIRMALNGEYRPRSLQRMSQSEVERYLEPHGPERFRVRERFRRRARFTVANLLDRGTLAAAGPYDVVFCRNVLIYFSADACRRAVENLADVTRRGGLLFFGHAESGMEELAALTPVRIGDCTAYRRTAS